MSALWYRSGGVTIPSAMSKHCPYMICNLLKDTLNPIKNNCYLILDVNRWIQACINEELPPTTGLEEGLRNGVFLAQLGHFLSPQSVPLKRIYDKEQTRYQVRCDKSHILIFKKSFLWLKTLYIAKRHYFVINVICL